MRYHIGQKVWASCDNRVLGKGELPAIVVATTGNLIIPYRVEIEGIPNPEGYNGWTAMESWLRPRDDDDDATPDKTTTWDKLSDIWKIPVTQPVLVDGEETE